MSNHPTIAALKSALESERNDEMTAFELCVGPVGYRNGHEAATERLMIIVEKAVEMAEFYGNEKNWNGYKHWDCMMIETDFEVAKQNDTDEQIEVAGRKAREFLTTLADASGEIKKEVR